MGRHAEQKLGAGLLQPIDQARAARQIVHDQFAAAGERGDQRAEAEIVTERAQRVEHSALQPPVARHHPRRGEQRVVAVQNALRLAGRAGGEGQIHDLVGIAARARLRAPGLAIRRMAQRRPGRRARRNAGSRGRPIREDVVPVGIGAVAGLGDQRRGAHAVDQRDDLANRVVAMQRRAADIAVARTGEQRDRGLDPARQPHRDAIDRGGCRGRRDAPPAGRRPRPAPA